MMDDDGVMTDALTWAGTYRGIGARLLREYAEQIGLELSTINSAKRQEWAVCLLMPSMVSCPRMTGTSAEIEEERRLLYVAMTPCKVHLVAPQRFFVQGQHARSGRHLYEDAMLDAAPKRRLTVDLYQATSVGRPRGCSLSTIVGGRMTRRIIQPWSASEDERLRKLASEGRSPGIIAERLKRTPASVRARAKTLRVVLTKVTGVTRHLIKLAPSERMQALRETVSAGAAAKDAGPEKR